MFRKKKYCKVHKNVRLQRIRRMEPDKIGERGRKIWWCRICGN